MKRLPVGLRSRRSAGYVSGAFGLGGGILKVPALNVWCGVPMRAAAATSGLMIGVTAVASVPIHYANGYLLPAHTAVGGTRRADRFAGRFLVTATAPGPVASSC